MNKKIIIASLNEIANELDNTGFYKEAIEITDVMVKLSQSMPAEFVKDDKTYPGMYFGPGKKQTPKLSPDEKREIITLLARAGEITNTQTSQFYNKGTGKVDENPGWDFINKQIDNEFLSPKAFTELKRQWAILAENHWAGRKQPQKTSITTPGVHNVVPDDIKIKAGKLVQEALQDESGNAWTNLKAKLHSNPFFAMNHNGQEYARKLFEYQLRSKGKNPSLKPIQEQSLGK
jgi:hypothetical protein